MFKTFGINKITYLATIVVVTTLITLYQSEYFKEVNNINTIQKQPIKLWQLQKDIVRAPVPVTGKVTGLGPPKLGEHEHAH